MIVITIKLTLGLSFLFFPGQWIKPDLMLTDKTLAKTVLGPQFYQLSQMVNFRSQRRLINFFTKRAPLGIEQWLVVPMFCQDGRVTVLPGRYCSITYMPQVIYTINKNISDSSM